MASWSDTMELYRSLTASESIVEEAVIRGSGDDSSVVEVILVNWLVFLLLSSSNVRRVRQSIFNGSTLSSFFWITGLALPTRHGAPAGMVWMVRSGRYIAVLVVMKRRIISAFIESCQCWKSGQKFQNNDNNMLIKRKLVYFNYYLISKTMRYFTKEILLYV